jgi:antitoxin MazE
MRTRIIRIGNSQGIRIPKPVLAQAGLAEEVELRVANGALVIRPAAAPRAGWAAAFQEMALRGDDALLDGDSPPTTWDEKDWQWR